MEGLFGNYFANHNLLYDDIEQGVRAWIDGDGSQKKYYPYIDFLSKLEVSDDEVESLISILSQKDNCKNEEDVRMKLINPMLEKILGYSHDMTNNEDSPLGVKGRVDYIIKYESRYLPIEAKDLSIIKNDLTPIKKKDNTDPTFQITNYLRGLNWYFFNNDISDKSANYGVLTDGMCRKLYEFKLAQANDKQPPCLVVDFSLLDKSNTAQIKLFIKYFKLFFGKDGLKKDGHLDKLFAENSKRSTQIEDTLKDQVFNALEYISNGIYLIYQGWKETESGLHKASAVIKHYKNTFPGYEEDKEARFLKVLYHESMVYLFRIIFGLYGEDRGLLDEVPNLLFTIKEGKNSVYEAIKKKFGNTLGGEDRDTTDPSSRFIDNEDKKLTDHYFKAINEKYNGGLFDDEKHLLLEGFDINDRYFLRALDYLMRIKQKKKSTLATINYSQLDVKHLGTIYENLLEYSLTQNTDNDKHILPLKLMNDKGERKATGSFYTPDYIVSYIVQNTVGKKIDDIVAEDIKAEEQIAKTSDLKVCDPAMGSGHFLVEVVDYIHQRTQAIIDANFDAESEKYQNLQDQYSKNQIASRCIYGVDINYLAVELAKLVIWIKTFDPTIPLQFLDYNLKRGNSLIGTNMDNLFEGNEIKKLDNLMNMDYSVQKSKAHQCVNIVSTKIKDYIEGVSKDKEDVQKKYTLYSMLNKKYFSDTKSLANAVGEGLGGSDYKERSKLQVARQEETFAKFNAKYPGVFKDWREWRDFLKLGIAYYNLRYMATVPLALSFLEESRANISSTYIRKLNQMTGTKGDGKKDIGLNFANIHLPTIYQEEQGNGLSVNDAVDEIVRKIRPFHWEIEFPTVFGGENGGFDCVVGNPPYGAGFEDCEFNFFNRNYKTSEYKVETYTLFLEKGTNLLKKMGKLGFIVPYTFVSGKYFAKTRVFLREMSNIEKIIVLGKGVFGEADVDTLILHTSREQNNGEFRWLNLKNIGIEEVASEISQSILQKGEMEKIGDSEIILADIKTLNLLKKMNNSTSLDELVNFYHGLQTRGDKKAISYKKETETHLQIIKGGDFGRYCFNKKEKYINFVKENIKSGGDITKYNMEEKLVMRTTGDYFVTSYDNKKYICLNSVNIILERDVETNLRYVLCVLNSNLIKFWYQSTIQETGKTFAEVKIAYLKKVPIKEIPLSDQKPFIEKADQMLSLNKTLHEKISKFLKRIESNLYPKKISKNIEKFYKLDFDGLLEELKKQKVVLSLSQQDEWEEYFDSYKKEVLELKGKIDVTDKEIDGMVFDLYGLSEEERSVVLDG